MSTIEERLQAIEREHTELKKTIELQTIAIGALVNKSTLEKLNEKYDKLFDVLNNHNIFTNERLGDMQGQLIELDGKIVGLQTEMRQRFNEQDNKIETRFEKVETRFDRLETKFDDHTTLLTQILERLPKNPNI